MVGGAGGAPSAAAPSFMDSQRGGTHAYPLCATWHCQRPAAPIQVARSFLLAPKRPTFCESPAFCGKKPPHRLHNHPNPPKPPVQTPHAPATLPPCSNPSPIRTILPIAQTQPATRARDSRPNAQFQHREPPSPKPAHLPANTTKTAAKTLPSTPIQPHDPPDALLELAEMRGNEREIDFSVLSPRNYKRVRVRRRAIRLSTRTDIGRSW